MRGSSRLPSDAAQKETGGFGQALGLAANGAGDTDPVFASATGGHMNAANLARRVLKPAAVRAGVGWASWHTLRHTCATELFRRGLNAKQVQVWLGHHSPAFTLETYVHLLSDDLPETPFGFEAPRPLTETQDAWPPSSAGDVRHGA
jgi:integrase